MIISFKCEETEKIYNRNFSRKFPHNIQRTAMRKLWMLHAAINVNDLRVPPANHLELLKGNKKGKYSIRVNDQWRICFCWAGGNAAEVEIIDYH